MEITQEIIDAFRATPPYGSFTVERWSDETVEQALCDADAETGGLGWGAYADDCHNFKRRGMFLYTAHWLASTFPGGDVAAGGSLSGGAKWATSAKSVADESVTFNNGNLSTATVGDVWLATTAFGQQWLRLRRRAGMGALAV